MTDEFEISKPQNSDDRWKLAAELLATAVKGMLLVTFIDGRPHWNKRESLIESVRTIGDHVSAGQLLKFLDETAEIFEDFPESTWAGFFESAQHLPGEIKRVILNLCTRVAFADGHLSLNESRLINQIADWIDVDLQNRELWKVDVHSALSSGEARGLKFTGIENFEWEK